MPSIVKITAWALYDLATKFFTFTVVSWYFVRWVTITKGVPEIFYGLAFSLSMIAVAILAPALGAFSDLAKNRRSMLIYFTLPAIAITAILGLVNNVFTALLLFILANTSIQLAVVFYNTLISHVASPKNMGLVSGIGKMAGYAGTILILVFLGPLIEGTDISHAALNSSISMMHDLLKVPAQGLGYQGVLIPSSILFLLFSLPCMIIVKDSQKGEKIHLGAFLNLSRLKETVTKRADSIRELSRLPAIGDFLKASFLAMCPLNALLLFMSVYLKQVYQMPEKMMNQLLIISAIASLTSSLLFGLISGKIGYKKSLYVIFVLWILSFAAAAAMPSADFYALIGILVGISLGALWTVSRPYAVALTPKEKMGELFGVFTLIGLFSAICGSLFWGLTEIILSPLGLIRYRIIIACLSIFMFFAFIYLKRLPEKHSIEE